MLGGDKIKSMLLGAITTEIGLLIYYLSMLTLENSTIWIKGVYIVTCFFGFTMIVLGGHITFFLFDIFDKESWTLPISEEGEEVFFYYIKILLFPIWGLSWWLYRNELNWLPAALIMLLLVLKLVYILTDLFKSSRDFQDQDVQDQDRSEEQKKTRSKILFRKFF